MSYGHSQVGVCSVDDKVKTCLFSYRPAILAKQESEKVENAREVCEEAAARERQIK